MLDMKLIDYATIRRYVGNKARKLGLPPCDIDDIVHGAYLASVKAAFRVIEANEPKKLALKIMHQAVVNELRSRNSRREKVWLDGVPVVEPDRDETNEDDDIVESGCVISDGGKGATRILRHTAAVTDYGGDPKWLKMFRSERKKLKGNEKRVLNALLKDSRIALISERVAISRTAIWKILENFRVRFAQCFQALRAWRLSQGG